MQYKPTKYCLVCKNFDASNGTCHKGWDVKFCNLDDFEPSFKMTVLNLLFMLYDEDVVHSAILDNIEDWLEKRFKEKR